MSSKQMDSNARVRLCSPSKPLPPTAWSKPFPTQTKLQQPWLAVPATPASPVRPQTVLHHRQQVGLGSEWEHMAPTLLIPAEKMLAQQHHFFLHLDLSSLAD